MGLSYEQPMLEASVRKEGGKGVSRRLRKEGKIPAVMCNHKGEATMLTVEAASFCKVWRNNTKTTSIRLVVDKKEMVAFIQDVEYDIKSDSVLHADFRVVDKDQLIKASYKVQYSGTPVGVREGGFMVRHVPIIDLKATYEYLPQRIVADISNVKIGDTFTVKDLKLDSNIKLLTKESALLVTVAPPKVK